MSVSKQTSKQTTPAKKTAKTTTNAIPNKNTYIFGLNLQLLCASISCATSIIHKFVRLVTLTGIGVNVLFYIISSGLALFALTYSITRGKHEDVDLYMCGIALVLSILV